MQTNRSSRARSSIVALLLLSLAFPGCTGFGYLLGSDLDHPRLDMPDERAEISAHRGREATIRMRDGSELEGVLDDTVRVPDDEYLRAFERWITSFDDTSHLPRPGETVTVVSAPGSRRRTGRFASIEGTQLHAGDAAIDIDDIEALEDSLGRPLDLELLRLAVRTRTIPGRAALRLRDASGAPTMIALEGISSVTVVASSTGRALLTILGAGLDAAAIGMWTAWKP